MGLHVTIHNYTTLRDYLLPGWRAGELRFTFGKWRGHLVADVDTPYLEWVLGTVQNLESALRTTIREELRHRAAAHSERRREHAPRLLPPPGVRAVHLRDIVSAGRRSLAAHYHPDSGGDIETMKLINAACDWLESLVGAEAGNER